MKTRDRTHDEWITAREVARRAAVHPNSVTKLAAASGIRVRRLPAVDPRYNAADLASVIEKHTAGGRR